MRLSFSAVFFVGSLLVGCGPESLGDRTVENSTTFETAQGALVVETFRSSQAEGLWLRAILEGQTTVLDVHLDADYAWSGAIAGFDLDQLDAAPAEQLRAAELSPAGLALAEAAAQAETAATSEGLDDGRRTFYEHVADTAGILGGHLGAMEQGLSLTGEGWKLKRSQFLSCIPGTLRRGSISGSAGGRVIMRDPYAQNTTYNYLKAKLTSDRRGNVSVYYRGTYNYHAIRCY